MHISLNKLAEFEFVRMAFFLALQLRGKNIVFIFFLILAQKYQRGYRKSCP